jgi:hypothetical protein
VLLPAIALPLRHRQQRQKMILASEIRRHPTDDFRLNPREAQDVANTEANHTDMQ